MYRSTRTTALLALSLSLSAAGARAEQITVAGTSDPFLAGLPVGTVGFIHDVAGAESPAFAGNVTGGELVSFSGVTGGVSYDGGTPTDGANGNSGLLVSTAAYQGAATQNHIAGFINAPVDALVGVFLGAAPPTQNPAPGVLNFADPTLYPQLQQIFFIGDGGLGAVTVPEDATRLYLGTVDGFDWFNDTGAIEVDVSVTPAGGGSVDEPLVASLLGLALLGLALARRRRA